MSWSYRITILYLGFVAIIITLVTISSMNKEELVSKDYYAQELKYEERMEALRNEKNLSESIEHFVLPGVVGFSLPDAMQNEKLMGEVYFFCPANSKNDKRVKMIFGGNGKFVFDTSELKPGAYKMCLSWTMDNKNYYREEVITIR